MNVKVLAAALFLSIVVYVGFRFFPTSMQPSLQEDSSQNKYLFLGTHFLASYKGCDSAALKNITEFKKVFANAVQSSGATILEHSFTDFGPDSMTGTFTLSESHASIHTYPEHNACFVDLFTCGSHCHWEPFHAILMDYLKPKTVNPQVITRN